MENRRRININQDRLGVSRVSTGINHCLEKIECSSATERSKIDIQIQNTTHKMGSISISAESFIAGFAYGGTTVLVGQPFETIKTLRQVQSASSARAAAKGSIFQTASNLYSTSGIRINGDTKG